MFPHHTANLIKIFRHKCGLEARYWTNILLILHYQTESQIKNIMTLINTKLAICALTLYAFSLEAYSQLTLHTPYLQNLSPTGVTVMYQTNASAMSHVEYWHDSTDIRSARQLFAGQEVVHSPQHSVRLHGLTPSTTYHYRVVAREILENHAYSKTLADSTVESQIYSFTTPPQGNYDFTVLILNDLHGNRETIRRLAEMAAKISHDLVVFNGDCLSEPASLEHAIDQLQLLVNAFSLHSTPSLFIRGNHEIRNAYSSGMSSLFDRFNGLTYGAFTLGGDTRFVVLDCGEDKPDDTEVYYGLNDFTGLRQEQTDFIKKELNSKEFKEARHRVCMHHIPLWGNTDKFSPCSTLWGPLLGKQPFDFDIAGHNHKATTLPSDPNHHFPVYIGGGPAPHTATILVLTRRGSNLSLTPHNPN